MTDNRRSVPLTTSLVKFNNPVLVEDKDEEAYVDLDGIGLLSVCQVTSQEAFGGPAPHKKAVDVQEILNCVVPPIQFEQEGKLWKQEISAEPATRSDVEKLSKELNSRLQQMQARSTGLCKVRNHLYTEAFNELIRQATVNCAERGVLLLAVRDEIEMTTQAYQTLYESSMAYGLRKALLAEEGKAVMEAQIQEMKGEISESEEKLAAMKHKYAMMERRAEELREAEERKHREEIAFLKKTNTQLKAQLEAIIAPKK